MPISCRILNGVDRLAVELHSAKSIEQLGHWYFAPKWRNSSETPVLQRIHENSALPHFCHNTAHPNPLLVHCKPYILLPEVFV